MITVTLQKGTGLLSYPMACQITTAKTMIIGSNNVIGNQITKNVSIIPYGLHINHTSIELKTVLKNEHTAMLFDQGLNETISLKNLQSKLKIVEKRKLSADLSHSINISSLTLGTTSMIAILIFGAVIMVGYLRCKSGNLRAR